MKAFRGVTMVDSSSRSSFALLISVVFGVVFFRLSKYNESDGVLHTSTWVGVPVF